MFDLFIGDFLRGSNVCTPGQRRDINDDVNLMAPRRQKQNKLKFATIASFCSAPSRRVGLTQGERSVLVPSPSQKQNSSELELRSRGGPFTIPVIVNGQTQSPKCGAE